MSISGRIRDTRPSRKSSHLKHAPKGTKACGACKGTGRSGWVTGSGATIVCGSCNGWGY